MQVNGNNFTAHQKECRMKENESDWAVGQELLGDYIVEGVLGEGGMGRVYLMRSYSHGNQFALKRALLKRESDRKNFLTELQTWIDLPEHPNLTACRFFRSLDDEILIFAEYVAGGTLQSWIYDRKLLTLDQILDVAIQFAWGLHMAHERGLIHQDVKPGNVLMTPDGVVKISDFGLARARLRGEEIAGGGIQSVLVSSGGLTPAYCSPEQKARKPLDRRTDIWSWGVSVLEMFYGEPPCAISGGEHALAVLEAYLESDDQDEGLAKMPVGVAVLLRQCFSKSVENRWRNLAEVLAVLTQEYQAATGKVYSRKLAGIQEQAHIKQERLTREGAQWADPQWWLERALQAEGIDAAEAKRILERTAGSRRGQLVADLAVFDEARQRFERLVQSGHKNEEVGLAELCMNKALVHLTASDLQGASNEYERAIEIQKRLVDEDGRTAVVNNLAAAYMNKANVVSTLGDKQAAVALYDRAIEVVERFVHQEGRQELTEALATACMSKAQAIFELGDKRAAAELLNRAIEILECLVNQDGRQEFADDLAKAYMNKAIVMRELGSKRAAVDLYNQAIEIFERLVHQEGRQELTEVLATAYMNKANAERELGDKRAAADLYDRVIEIAVRLIDQEGRRDIADFLAKACINKAVVVNELGDKQAAVGLYDRAIEILERFVHQEGRQELADNLAKSYMSKALLVSELGDNHAAGALYDRAIKIRELLVHQEGRLDLGGDLATVYMNKAAVENDLGNKWAAAELYDRAIELVGRLIDQERRQEFAELLAKLYMNKAVVMQDLGDFPAAIELHSQAIGILDPLVHQEGRQELAYDLTWEKACRALALLDTGDFANGIREGREAEKLLRIEVITNGRADLQQFLDWFTNVLNQVRQGRDPRKN
jgi:tetratricopeptide (TPR) repeat protein